MTDRPNYGITVQPVSQCDKYGLPCAAALDDQGIPYLINQEGVGYSISGQQYSELDAIGEPIYLAEWIREFGARLEANYHTWVYKLSGQVYE